MSRHPRTSNRCPCQGCPFSPHGRKVCATPCGAFRKWYLAKQRENNKATRTDGGAVDK